MRTEAEKAETGVLARMLAALAAAIGRRPLPVLLLALVTAGAAIWATLRFLEYQTQRNDLISPDKDYLRRWREYTAEFGDDDDMVVVVQGACRKEMVAALEALAGDIGQQADRFDRLFYKVDLQALRSRALLFLPAEKIRHIQDSLRSMSLLLEPPVLVGLDPLFSWKSLTVQQLVHEAGRRVTALDGDRPPPSADEQFLLQLDAICRSASRTIEEPARYQNPWHSILQSDSKPPFPKGGTELSQPDLLAEPQYFFSSDGGLAFLLVRPVKEQASFTSARESVQALRQTVARLETRFPNLTFGVTGLPVLENDEMVASQADSTRASWLALAGVALLYLVVYRSVRFPLMTVAALLVGTAWALGWTTWTVGHLNILSSAFAVMLIGMGDYGILWVTRYLQERQQGADLDGALRQTAGHVGPSILTAAVTTALAFFAATLADFKAVSELGWIAGSGILLCGLSCFVLMPALLALFDRRLSVPRVTPRDILPLPQPEAPLWLPWLTARPHAVLIAGLTLSVLLGAAAFRVRYDHNLLHLQAHGLESVQWEKLLIERTAGASWHALSSTTTPEEALALKARYEKLPTVSRVAEVASLVPRDQERKLEQLRDIQQRLRRLPGRGLAIPHALPDVADLHRALGRLQEALAGLNPAKVGGVVTTLTASVETLRGQLAAANPERAARHLRDFEQKMTRDLAEDLHRLRDVSQPGVITVADLPPSLRERFIGNSGKWLLRVYAKDCVWEYEPLKRFVAQIYSVDPEATGKPFSTLEGLRSMRNGFLWAALYALAAIISVLLLDFRNLKHALLALAPLAMGLILTLGLLALAGAPLNPANMIALPLILGVGADNGVHVLHDFRSRPGGRRYALSQATGRGILVAALTTVLGFGTLMISGHQGMASLGLVLTLGVTCSMVSALVFLPAVLHLISVHKQTRRRERKKAPPRPARGPRLARPAA